MLTLARCRCIRRSISTTRAPHQLLRAGTATSRRGRVSRCRGRPGGSPCAALLDRDLVRATGRLCGGGLIVVVRLGAPVTQVVLGVVEDLASLGAVGVCRARVAGNDGRVVQEPQQAAAVAGQDDLLLCALDDGGELGLIGLLQLLTGLTDVLAELPPGKGCVSGYVRRSSTAPRRPGSLPQP